MIRRENLQTVNFHEFMFRNEPVIIEGIDSAMWSINDYFIDQETQNFHPNRFVEVCGDEIIPIHSNRGVEEMKICNFITKLMENQCVYAKDWHMFKYCPENVYTVPTPFIDDWLNWFWKRCRSNSDDYRFVYIGGMNTMTGVHHDVLCSYSWSVNLYGRKRWRIWGPKDVQNLFSINNKSIVSDARDGNYDPLQYPNVSQSNPIIVDQNPHEAIFIPSGWYHMVENLNLNLNLPSVTLSLNHNWFNGYSLHKNWEYLLSQYQGVYEEIEMFHPLRQHPVSNKQTSSSAESNMTMPLSDWYHHSQYLLQLQTGMNHVEFIALICLRIHSLVMISLQKDFSHEVDDLFKDNPSALIQTLGMYLFNTSSKSSPSSSSSSSSSVECDEYILHCCSGDQTDEKIFSQLTSHSIEINEIESLISDDNLQLPLVTQSFQQLRSSVFSQYSTHPRPNLSLGNNSPDDGSGNDRKMTPVMSMTAWRYYRLQVRCILLSLITQPTHHHHHQQQHQDIFNSICVELNCEQGFLQLAIEEYIARFL